MPALVVPGVRVEARFDVLPPLPAPSGILGAVGIVDRPPRSGGLVAVTKTTEIRQLLGPGTAGSMPEVAHALANGVSEVVISPVAGGRAASARLLNANAQEVVLLRTRSNGAGGNGLRAEVRTITNASNQVVRVTLQLLRGAAVLETFADLQVAPGQPDDLFDAINQHSAYVIAIDPGFAGVNPRPGTYAFTDQDPQIDVAEPAPGTRNLLLLRPAGDADPAGLSVQIDAGQNGATDVRVFQRGLQEEYTDLVMEPDSDQYLPYVLANESRLVRFTPLSSRDQNRMPAATATPVAFADGQSPSVDQYQDAIDRLGDDPRIDLVPRLDRAGRDDGRRAPDPPGAGRPRRRDGRRRRRRASRSARSPPASSPSLDQIREHAALVRNRRFVLVVAARCGGRGRRAGRAASTPQDSPTFKPVPLFGIAPATYRESELNRLLGADHEPARGAGARGRGVVVLQGIDTTGDQISVTRVADQRDPRDEGDRRELHRPAQHRRGAASP